nr:MAG TPA: hypothetical protein [Caudoviricetes sp.]
MNFERLNKYLPLFLHYPIFVTVKIFYPLLLIVSYKFSISFHQLRCPCLVGRLYLFTTYALPLTRLNLAFGSD